MSPSGIDAELDEVVYYDDGGVRVSAAAVRLPSETIPLADIAGVAIERRRLTVAFVALFVLLSIAISVAERLTRVGVGRVLQPLALLCLAAVVASIFVRVRYVSLRLHSGRKVEGPAGTARSGRVLAAVRTALEELNEVPADGEAPTLGKVRRAERRTRRAKA